jgi:hypothetical protein
MLHCRLWNLDGFTQVPICAWNNAWKGAWGFPPPVKPEHRHVTYTVCLCDINPIEHQNTAVYNSSQQIMFVIYTFTVLTENLFVPKN